MSTALAHKPAQAAPEPLPAIVRPGTAEWTRAEKDMMRVLSGMPHLRQSFDPDKARRWCGMILEREGGGTKRCYWHMRRLTGIGGSEIGGLVDELRGEPSPFKTARQTVGEKLLAYMPDAPSDDMLRGIRSEGVIRDAFHAMVGGKSHEDALAKLSGCRHPVHRWMISSPDDIVKVGVSCVLDGFRLEPGDLILVDYKCPSANAFPTYVSGGVPSYWQSQLHQYDELSRTTLDLRFKARFIVMFDLDRFEPHPKLVPYQPELVEELVAAGSTFWNDFVLKGELPPWPERRKAIDVEVPEDILEAAGDLGRIKAMKSELEEREKEIQTRIKAWAETAGELGDGKIKLGEIGTITGKPVMSVPRLVDEAKRLARLTGSNVDVDSMRLPDAIDIDEILAVAAKKDIDLVAELRALLSRKGIDLDKFFKRGDFNVAEICAMFQEMGGDPSMFLTETASIRLSQSKKGKGFEILSRFSEVAKDVVAGAVEAVKAGSAIEDDGPMGGRGGDVDLAAFDDS